MEFLWLLSIAASGWIVCVFHCSRMSWRYFFDQDTVIHSGVEISAYKGNRIEDNIKKVTEVVHGEYVISSVRQLFQIDFIDMFELCKTSDTFKKLLTFLFRTTSKKSLICKIIFQPFHYTSNTYFTTKHGHIAIIVINDIDISAQNANNAIINILDGYPIPDMFDGAKFNLIFDYEPVDTDSIETCFAEINQRNDQFNTIPLYSYRSSYEWLNLFKVEKDSTASHLTKLLIFSSYILEKYFGSKNYIDKIEMKYNREFMLFENINKQSSKLISDLQNKAVHKMENEIRDFMDLLTQLEKLIRRKEVRTDIKNDQYKQCVRNLDQLFYLDVIPKSDAWIQIQNSSFALSEERENWKKRVIWLLRRELPDYYGAGELSTYSWVVDSKTKETEPRLIINGEKYYFGIASVEEKQIRNNISKDSPKNLTKYAFRDKDELCKSITCPCSPAKKRLWLCERCLWLVRMHGPTGVSCRCTRNTLEKMKVYCNGCQIDEVGTEPIVDKETEPIVQHQILDDINSNANRNQIQGKNAEEVPKTAKSEEINNKESKPESVSTVPLRAQKKTGFLAELTAERLKQKTPTVSKINEYNGTTVTESQSEDTCLSHKNTKDNQLEKENTIIQKSDKQSGKSTPGDQTRRSEPQMNQKDHSNKQPSSIPNIVITRQMNDMTSQINYQEVKNINPRSISSSSKCTDSINKTNYPTKHHIIRTGNDIPVADKKEDPKSTENSDIRNDNIQSNLASPLRSPVAASECNHDITTYTEYETIPFQLDLRALAEEWNKIITAHTEHETIPLLIVPSPPVVTAEWDNIITVYIEHQKIPLIIIPSPPAVTAEWDNIVTVYIEHETTPLIIVPPSPPQECTVIFLGESGVGKSTLISSLGNYLNWPTFEEAKKNQMEICIPVEFKVQKKLEEGGFDETTVRAGDFEDNENFNDVGQSVTQKPKVHEFTFQNNTVKVIDTPGLSDTRGAEQDKKNLELIREFIHNQKEIHAICIVLKSNESKLGNQFELAIRDLLSLFPKSALKNVFFFFTYARGTYFGIGDILNPLKELQQKFKDSHGVTFEFEGRNMCPVDSESFRYLLCKEQGIKYSSSAEERFEYCWNETAKQVLDFLAFLKGVDSVDVEKIKAAHEIAKTALELEEFLRTDKTLKKGLSEEARELLNEKAKPLFFIAKDLTMVSEYYRLKTNLIRFDSKEAVAGINKLLPIVKNSSVYDGLSKFVNNLSLPQTNKIDIGSFCY